MLAMPRVPARLIPALLAVGVLSAQPPQPECAIDGTVVNSVTGELIARARVMAMGKNGQSSTTADNAGRWRFTNLACGQAQIVASRPGFLQGSLGQPRLGAAFRPVILAPDSPVHDAKITLTPQTVVTGRVLDDQGDPMMAVTVTAMVARVVEGRRMFQNSGSANTNDLGEYRIPNLVGGKYFVCAHPNVAGADTDSTVVQERCFPGPVEGGSASAMDISGTTARVDFNLARVPAVKIRGTLSGAPGRGPALSLFKRTPTMANRMGTQAVIAPDGKFEIRGVSPGSYLLSTDYWEAGKRLIARVPIEVGGADIDGVNVRLEPAFTVTGTVRTELKQSPTPAGRPLNLVLRSSDPASAGGQIAWSKTRDSFTVNELTPGNYRLESIPNGPLYIKSATLAGRDISKEEIPITQAAGPVVVVLSDDTGSIQGHVEDSDGKPTACWIMVLPANDPLARLARNVMSGPDGHFNIPNVPPGDYNVYAWDDWQQVEYANPEWMRRYSAPVSATVETGQSVQLKLREQLVPVQ